MNLDEHGRWSDEVDEYGRYVAAKVTQYGRFLFRYADFVEVIATLTAYARNRALTLYHASTDFAAYARARALTGIARSRTLTFFARLLNITLYDREDE